MYVIPDSKIYLLSNVPLEPTYEHTIFFQTLNEQIAYFDKLVKYRLTKYSFQRANSNVVTVELPVDKLYDCNYIMFQNTAFGDKWFFGFITSVNYVSNTVSSVTYTIDVLQTWHFDYQPTTCFIERQHTETDNYGEHLIDEGIDIGETLNGRYTFGDGWDEYSICVVTAFDKDKVSHDDFTPANGGYYSLLYCGLDIAVFPVNEVSVFDNVDVFLNKITSENRTSSVVGLFMCPSMMVQEKTSELLPDYSAPTSRMISVFKPYDFGFSYANKPGSYMPKNKKLFNYPYCSLMVTNGDGDTKTYKWENFNSPTESAVFFQESFIFSPSPVAATAPLEYGQNEDYRIEVLTDPLVSRFHLVANNDEALLMNDFPTCAYAVDSYRAWLAQKKASLPYEIAGHYLGNAGLRSQANMASMNALRNTSPYAPMPFENDLMQEFPQQMIGGSVSPRITGRQLGAAAKAGLAAGGAALAVDTAGMILDQMKQFAMAKLIPEGINGTISGNGYSTAMRLKRFTYIQRSIKGEYAKMIDDYFTMFGYKINRMGVPNRKARPHWTFIKTTNFQLIGSIPADDAQTIADLYNAGITWWRNGDEIGNYNLNNSPVGGV